ncbi:Tubulin-specific chaperone D [Grifola frondosa]|uniref:Tubulin-specific chaperone D n=1 Tax=Grifola frondosa TaxID=5627 RepID=A0A1C7M527_GRIFR|nr:Tubulin-specific chaperone D [Grifola frondosa]
MEEDLSEGKLFATFENHEEFLNLQSSLLSLDISTEPSAEDNRAEELLLRKLSDILDQYQEQAYLLDPFLEVLVAPVVERLKRHTKDFISRSNASVSPARLRRVTLLLYNFIKFRGYKTATRFFPHEISDLSVTLDYILSPNSPAQDASQWPLRYVVLLWLSLVCMIPFDLEQFDEQDKAGETATRVESLAKSYLGKAGLEREGAAILLSRLYMRKDMSAKLPGFLDWSISIVQVPSDPFEFIGILQVLCEVTKLGAAEQVKEHLPLFLQVTRSVNDNETLINNTIVRKLRTKLISRNGGMDQAITPGDDDFDVPEEVESVLEDLFKALQDKDTIVRYSSAKGIARISERLPVEFTEQVLETVMGLFSIHSIAVASIYDMPSIAESTWHGACLACAEMARRGLVADEKLTELIGWLSKALYFDIRKGSHSIGSNVRDAASYVLWSLARAQSVAALEPHAVNLARRLATVSLFDREIHIRRAASAAFQEYVGRTSLFPHGIDVLRKTDFYAVGVRRNAFLVAAPEVAEHEEYRTSLIDHLLSVTLRHWDPAMRQLGAQSLRAICQLDLAHLAPNAARRASQLLDVPDAGDVHGALLALTEIAAAFGESRDHYALELERKKVFTYLHEVPLTMIQSPRHELVTAASCRLIASSISLDDIQLNQDVVPSWRQIVDSGFKSRSSTVQEAAATALASVSRLIGHQCLR